MHSSPIQIPGTTWSKVAVGDGNIMAVKTDGTLWGWGNNFNGELGINAGDTAGRRSSPTQIPGTDWTNVLSTHGPQFAATKLA